MTSDTEARPTEHSISSPVGETDSRVGVGLANLTQTSVTVITLVTEDVTTSTAELDERIREAMGMCGQLVVERDRATAELRRKAKDILYPDLIEMRKRYKNAGARTDLCPGIPTFEAYLASIGFCSSILRVWDHRRDHRHREKQKELESLLPSQGHKQFSSGPSSGASGSSDLVTIDDGNAGVMDATFATFDAGYMGCDAEQAAEQTITDDATLVNVNAAGMPMELVPVDDDSLEYDLSALSQAVPPTLTRRVSPSTSASVPVVTTTQIDRTHLCSLVKRLNSVSQALQQLVDDKAKTKLRWSKYAEYAEVVSAGEKIAGLVNLLL